MHDIYIIFYFSVPGVEQTALTPRLCMHEQPCMKKKIHPWHTFIKPIQSEIPQPPTPGAAGWGDGTSAVDAGDRSPDLPPLPRLWQVDGWFKKKWLCSYAIAMGFLLYNLMLYIS